MNWAWCIALIFSTLFCYAIGYRNGCSESQKFIPTQETWLELEKFKWTTPYGTKNTDKID